MLIGIAVALLMTWLLLIATLAIRRPKGKELQLEAAYRQFSSSGVPAGRSRRLRLPLLVLAMLVILNVVWLGLLLSRAPGERAVESTSTHDASPGGLSSGAARSPTSGARSRSVEGRETIQVEDVPDSARPFETVRIQGTYRGGGDTFLRVQRWEGGEWLAFPIPTKTDQSGQFTAHVEFGQPGRYRLRVLDPGSGLASKTFVIVIEG